MRFIVVGSPGAVDTDFFRRDPKDPSKAAEMSAMYNKTLGVPPRHRQAASRRSRASRSPTSTARCTTRCPRPRRSSARTTTSAAATASTPTPTGTCSWPTPSSRPSGATATSAPSPSTWRTKKAEASDGHKVVGEKDGELRDRKLQVPLLLLRRPQEPLRHPRHHRGVPVQRGTQPLQAGREERAGPNGEGDVGRRVEGVLRGRPGEGDQPGGGVRGRKSVQRAVQAGRGGGPAVSRTSRRRS